MKNRNRKSLLAAICLAAVILTGCREGVPIVSEVQENRGYTLPQSMIVVATERNRYQSIYTDEIWNVQVEDDGTTFQEHMLEGIRDFLEELKTINMLAQEEGIALSGQEEERLKELASAYFAGLTEDDIAYTQATEQDVYVMYEQYHIANKLVEQLTKDVDVEISDSEARVMEVQQIEMSDEMMAEAVYEQATAEDADFTALARTYSEDSEIQKKVGRSERPGNYEDAVFVLEQDEISPIFQSDGKFYIVKCVNVYDEAATQERKVQLTRLRRNQAFRQIYDQYVAEHSISFTEPVWESMTFSAADKTTTTNFFDLYKEYIAN